MHSCRYFWSTIVRKTHFLPIRNISSYTNISLKLFVLGLDGLFPNVWNKGNILHISCHMHIFYLNFLTNGWICCWLYFVYRSSWYLSLIFTRENLWFLSWILLSCFIISVRVKFWNFSKLFYGRRQGQYNAAIALK
jgi:hypothetical protein